jgi:hypothetical protein
MPRIVWVMVLSVTLRVYHSRWLSLPVCHPVVVTLMLVTLWLLQSHTVPCGCHKVTVLVTKRVTVKT